MGKAARSRAHGCNSSAQEAETGGWEDGKVGESGASLGCHKQTSSSSNTVRNVFSKALHFTISWFTSLLFFLCSAGTSNALNKCSFTSTQQNKDALLLLNNRTSLQPSPNLKRLWNRVSYAKVVWGTPRRLDNCTRAETSFSRCHNNSSKRSHLGIKVRKKLAGSHSRKILI